MSAEIEEAILFIQQAGKKLRLPLNTIARAMILYHHFKRCIDTVKYDDRLSAAAAIGLSSKVDEEPVSAQNIVIVFLNFPHGGEKMPKISSKEFENYEKSLLTMQYIIARMLKFTLKHELAYQYLVHFLRCLQKQKEFEEKWSSFASTVFKVVSTAYLTRRCLDYEASEIAMASIQIAAGYCYISIDNIKNWQQMLSVSLNPEKFKNAVIDILSVCQMSVDTLPLS